MSKNKIVYLSVKILENARFNVNIFVINSQYCSLKICKEGIYKLTLALRDTFSNLSFHGTFLYTHNHEKFKFFKFRLF